MSLLQVIPKSALQAGYVEFNGCEVNNQISDNSHAPMNNFFRHIFMGLTQCGRFVLTYTYSYNIDVGVLGGFKYYLHWWAFTPNKVAKKVAEVTLFGNYSIHKELTIVIAQWPTERNKLVIHGFW